MNAADPWAPLDASGEERVRAFQAEIQRREREAALSRKETPDEIILRELCAFRAEWQATQTSSSARPRVEPRETSA